ncbi:MAG: RecX family transcriptional regulator [Flavobacteriales bacterium]|nr:RecX family transcriptional regulator [Flavobacteriales bacterium]
MSVSPEILEKARHYCAYQERCQQEVRKKLYTLGLGRQDVELLIASLITENFINEERFSRAFARGKFRIKRWGKIRINLELKQRNISPYCIRKAMEEIPDDEYQEALDAWILKKAGTSGRSGPAVNKRIADFVIGKGFEPALVWKAVRNILNT